MATKKISFWKSMFFIVLFTLAACPFGIVGHELFHLAYGTLYGRTEPYSLCLEFGGPIFASARSCYCGDQTHMAFKMRFMDELLAYSITIFLMLAMFLLFVKIYFKLLKEGHKEERK